MKGLLTKVAHTDEPIVGEVLPYPVWLLSINEDGALDKPIHVDVDVFADCVRLAVEDEDELAAVRLLPEQAKALHDALGVALYGN